MGSHGTRCTRFIRRLGHKLTKLLPSHGAGNRTHTLDLISNVFIHIGGRVNSEAGDFMLFAVRLRRLNLPRVNAVDGSSQGYEKEFVIKSVKMDESEPTKQSFNRTFDVQSISTASICEPSLNFCPVKRLLLAIVNCGGLMRPCICLIHKNTPYES